MARPRGYSEDLKAAVLEEIDAGEPVAKVAEKYDVSRAIPYRWLQRREKERAGPPPMAREIVIDVLNVLGNVTFGDAVTDTITVTGTFFPRWLPSDPATTHPSGTVGELAYFSGKLYVCTDATVGAEVWEALN